MKLAADVRFEGDGALAAAVAFDDWDAAEPAATYTTRIARVDPVERGKPDLRRTSCLVQLLRDYALVPEVVLIDGLVHLDAHETPGWGLHLHEALGGRTAVIGISRTGGQALPAQFHVLRETDSPTVVVTCAGIDIGAAKARVRAMHGKRRVPTLCKRAARATRGEAEP